MHLFKWACLMFYSSTHGTRYDTEQPLPTSLTSTAGGFRHWGFPSLLRSPATVSSQEAPHPQVIRQGMGWFLGGERRILPSGAGPCTWQPSGPTIWGELYHSWSASAPAVLWQICKAQERRTMISNRTRPQGFGWTFFYIMFGASLVYEILGVLLGSHLMVKRLPKNIWACSDCHLPQAQNKSFIYFFNRWSIHKWFNRFWWFHNKLGNYWLQENLQTPNILNLTAFREVACQKQSQNIWFIEQYSHIGQVIWIPYRNSDIAYSNPSCRKFKLQQNMKGQLPCTFNQCLAKTCRLW